jgi:hypothetical protein
LGTRIPYPNMNCHPDRSEAKWRDLLFYLPANESSMNAPPPPLHPERSAAHIYRITEVFFTRSRRAWPKEPRRGLSCHAAHSFSTTETTPRSPRSSSLLRPGFGRDCQSRRPFSPCASTKSPVTLQHRSRSATRASYVSFARAAGRLRRACAIKTSSPAGSASRDTPHTEDAQCRATPPTQPDRNSV